MNTQLCVLGGGPGGYAAAFLAADLGMQVTLVDLEPRLGGVCLLRGCIPSKALLHVSKAIAEAKHLGQWGVAFPEPTIDVAAVRARKEKVIATLTTGLKQIAGKRKVNVVRARAAFEDSHVCLVEALLEPFSVVLENDQRLHEMAAMRAAAEADKESLLKRLGRRKLSDTVIGENSGLQHVTPRRHGGRSGALLRRAGMQTRQAR